MAIGMVNEDKDVFFYFVDTISQSSIRCLERQPNLLENSLRRDPYCAEMEIIIFGRHPPVFRWTSQHK